MRISLYYIVFIIMLFFCIESTIAQNTTKVISFTEFYADFQRCETWYTASSYSVKTNFKSFESYTSTEIEDEFSGYVLKHGNKMKSFSMGIYTIINDEIVLSVDTSESVILIGEVKNEKQTAEEKKEEELYNLDEIQNNIKTVIKTETTNGFKYEINYIEGNEYEKVIIEINKQYQLKKQILFFSEQLDLETNQKTKPRIEITYRDFMTDIKIDEKEFNPSSYYVKDNKGYKGINEYKTYEIFDTRVK